MSSTLIYKRSYYWAVFVGLLILALFWNCPLRAAASSELQKKTLMQVTELIEAEKYDQALSRVKRAIEIEGESDILLVQLSVIYAHLGMYDKAENILQRLADSGKNVNFYLDKIEELRRRERVRTKPYMDDLKTVVLDGIGALCFCLFGFLWSKSRRIVVILKKILGKK